MKPPQTPEEAILHIEEAYRQKDIEAAVAAKDFVIEARLLLERLHRDRGEGPVPSHMIPKTAEVLELSFRDWHRRNGFPDMQGVVSEFPQKEEIEDGIWAVTEICRWPNGGTSRQRLLVADTGRGWKVLNPIKEPNQPPQTTTGSGAPGRV